MPAPDPSSNDRAATMQVGRGCVLDARRALYHEEERWLAVSDMHHGIELNHARRPGCVPAHGHMKATERRLMELVADYQPERLILLGDVMDGGGSVYETAAMIRRLRGKVPQLVLIEGNHDRAALRRSEQFVPVHFEGEFIFHHGHRLARTLRECPGGEGCVHLCGHEHPAVDLRDGAGLRLLLPAMVQDRLQGHCASEHWILPAFSPWAGSACYRSANERLATYVCTDNGVLPVGHATLS